MLLINPVTHITIVLDSLLFKPVNLSLNSLPSLCSEVLQLQGGGSLHCQLPWGELNTEGREAFAGGEGTLCLVQARAAGLRVFPEPGLGLGLHVVSSGAVPLPLHVPAVPLFLPPR